jgi:hypothetical protein
MSNLNNIKTKYVYYDFLNDYLVKPNNILYMWQMLHPSGIVQFEYYD